MKVCFIIMAHHQTEVFQKLVDQICWDNSDIIVHVDKRADLKKFDLLKRNNIHFLKKRKKVHWCGWSQTKTMLELLRHGLKLSDANYFIFLAGTDFPIKNRRALTEFLTAKYPANFLNHYPLVPDIWGYALISRYRLTDLRGKFADPRFYGQKNVSKIRVKLGNLVSKFEIKLNERFAPRNTTWVNFYHGSTRWCLNRETVQYLVNYFQSKSSQRLKKYLRLAGNSDEIFIQTAILNSPMKKYCIGFNEVVANEIFENKRPPHPDEIRVYLHYIDWSPEREDPAILDESDFDSLLSSNKFFACKFTAEKSLGLINLFEGHKLNQR